MVTRSSRRMMVAPAALPKSKDLRRSKDMQDWMEAAPVGQEQASNIRNHSSSKHTHFSRADPSKEGCYEYLNRKRNFIYLFVAGMWRVFRLVLVPPSFCCLYKK